MLSGFFIFTLIINYSTQTFVDLGHEINHDVPVYPLPLYLEHRFKLTVLQNKTTGAGFWLAYNSLCTAEHVSTHIDAPYHFYEKGWTVDQIPLEHLIAPAVVIDVTEKVVENPNYLICAKDVENWVAENGVIPNNSVILGRTGWSKKFYDVAAYLGSANDYTKMVSPGFGVDAIRRILDYKKSDDIHVVGFGIDTISLDHGASTTFDAHQIVQGENIYIIENMNNLEALPQKGATLFVMPMKITAGTGAPARVIAQLPLTEEVTTLVPSSVPIPYVVDARSADSDITINEETEAFTSEPTFPSTIDEATSEDATTIDPSA